MQLAKSMLRNELKTAPKYVSGVDWNLRGLIHALMSNHLHAMLSKDTYTSMSKCPWNSLLPLFVITTSRYPGTLSIQLLSSKKLSSDAPK